MDDLMLLLITCSATPFRTVLLCAADVWESVRAADVPAALASPLEFDACELTGTVVITAPGYQPGRWKLIQHDNCCVTRSRTCLDSPVVTHDGCTVLGEAR
jgi:hypothetical protein